MFESPIERIPDFDGFSGRYAQIEKKLRISDQASAYERKGGGGGTGTRQPVAISRKFDAGDGLLVALQRILEDVVRLLAHFMGNLSRQGRGGERQLVNAPPGSLKDQDAIRTCSFIQFLFFFLLPLGGKMREATKKELIFVLLKFALHLIVVLLLELKVSVELGSVVHLDLAILLRSAVGLDRQVLHPDE